MDEINVNQETAAEVIETVADSNENLQMAVGFGLIALAGVGVYNIGKFVVNKGIKPVLAKRKASKEPTIEESIDAVTEN